VRQLLLVSGLRGDIETKTDWHGRQTAIEKASAEKLQGAPGTAFRYSDINFFLLGEIVQRVSGRPLEEFVAAEVFRPLKMTDTGYLPPEAKRPRIAPTEVVDGNPYRGVVHDPTARKMGGVAGHAGLFTTAADLARYSRMLLTRALDGVHFLPEQLIHRVQTPESFVRRDGRFELTAQGEAFLVGSYGHNG
jgi:CubicO group peptidase (beta-lactamase class C family)